MDEMIKILNSIPIGEKITLTLNDMFGDPYNIRCRLIEQPKQDGFICKGDSWGKYDTGKLEEKPCYKTLIRKKGCSSTNNCVRLDKIRSIGMGW
jgi:hypothetical protein